ncbi:MAG: hypothetical protein JRC86_05490 [Deltaproteobacteria bacterium]|nr:hypothetical protein [Deltaproteobacteria bacterium]
MSDENEKDFDKYVGLCCELGEPFLSIDNDWRKHWAELYNLSSKWTRRDYI